MACVVEDVTAPDGTRSTLFDQLLQVTASDQEAMRLYLNVMNEPLNEDIIQDNGEPHLGDVINRDDLGFTEKHRGLYASRDYSVAGKKTTATQGIVQQVDNILQRVENRLSGNISESERERLRERRSKLQKQKSRIQTHSSVEEVREIATEHIDWAKDILSNPEIATDDEILLGIQLMDAWSYNYTSEALTDEQKQSTDPGEATGFNKLFLQLNEPVSQVRNNLIGIATQRILDDMNQNMVTAPEGGFSVEDVQDFENVDVPNRMINMSDFFDLAVEDQKMVQRMDDILKNAKRNKATEIRRINDRLAELSEPVDDVTDLLQKDENGNFTGGLVNPYSIEFTESQQEAIEDIAAAQRKASAQGVSAGTSSRKNAIRNLRSIGELVDVRFFIDELDSPSTYGSQEEYRQHLIDTLGEQETKRAIRAAKEAWNEYTKKRQGFRTAVEGEIANGDHLDENMSTEEYRDQRMEEFRRRESPEVILEEFHEGASPTVFNDGWQHAYLAADKEHQSDQWKGLGQAEKNLAKYLRDLYSDLFSLLPDHIARRRQENFLPRIKKDVVERMQEDGMKAAASQIGRDFFDNVTGDEVQSLLDSEEGMPNPMTGLGNKNNVPIRWVFDGNIEDISNMSQDILRMTEMFSSMAINYNYMSQVEPMAQLMARIAKENINKPEDSNLMERIEYGIDAMLYDERRSTEEGPGDVFVTKGTPGEILENRREASRLQREYEELLQKKEDGEISRTEFKQREKELEGQYADLKGKTLAPWRVLEETIGRFTMLSSIGFDVQTGIANGMFGIMAMSVHAAGEQDFTTKEFHSAFMTYLNEKMAGSGKAGNLMTNMDILHEISEIAYGRGEASKQERRNFVRRVKDSPYALIRGTENMIQSVTMIAIMMNEKVEVEMNGETQEISLWQGFDDSGEWNSERYGEKPELEPATGPEQKNRWTNLRDKVIQVNKRLHGNYDVNSPTNWKRLSLRRLIIMFRSWMPEGFRYRLGKEMEVEQTGRTVKGSYRSPFDVATEHGAKGLGQLFKAAFNKDWKGENSDIKLDEIDIRNFRKVLKDFKWLLGMTATIVALQSMIEDDEEDTAADFAAKSMINTLTRTRQDITHYLDPSTPYNLLNNPIPALRTLGDAGRALNGTKKYLTDPDYRGSPVYQWTSAFTPFQQVHDLGTMAYNIENSGEFSTKFNE